MNKIKELRTKANLTQKEFCKIFAIPERTLQSWEQGKRKPPLYLEILIIEKLETMCQSDGF